MALSLPFLERAPPYLTLVGPIAHLLGLKQPGPQP
jgi:hypothetical protein